MSFTKREDKVKLMTRKCNLPSGIYVNDEFPIQVNMNRDKLRPILRITKKHPDYKDKCKLQGDKLIINGIKYTVETLGNLPIELAAYKLVQNENEMHLAFHSEHSPYSNFHPSPFNLNGERFNSSEQLIQYQKALMFGDSVIANEILRSDTALEAKKLGYKMLGPSFWFSNMDLYCCSCSLLCIAGSIGESCVRYAGTVQGLTFYHSEI